MRDRFGEPTGEDGYAYPPLQISQLNLLDEFVNSLPPPTSLAINQCAKLSIEAAGIGKSKIAAWTRSSSHRGETQKSQGIQIVTILEDPLSIADIAAGPETLIGDDELIDATQYYYQVTTLPNVSKSNIVWADSVIQIADHGFNLGYDETNSLLGSLPGDFAGRQSATSKVRGIYFFQLGSQVTVSGGRDEQIGQIRQDADSFEGLLARTVRVELPGGPFISLATNGSKVTECLQATAADLRHERVAANVRPEHFTAVFAQIITQLDDSRDSGFKV